jgi:hypothetical protein
MAVAGEKPMAVDKPQPLDDGVDGSRRDPVPARDLALRLAALNSLGDLDPCSQSELAPTVLQVRPPGQSWELVGTPQPLPEAGRSPQEREIRRSASPWTAHSPTIAPIGVPARRRPDTERHAVLHRCTRRCVTDLQLNPP